jgi:hypothetical protein
MCSPGSLLQAFQNALYKAYSSHQKEKQPYRLFGGKIKMLKRKPSREQSPCPELFVVPVDIGCVGSWSKFVMQK